MRAIVESVRQLKLNRAPVNHVDQRVHTRQRLFLAHAAQQRLVRRPRLGRIEPDPLVHRPHRGGFFGRMRAHSPLGLGQQRIEPRLALDDVRTLPPEQRRPHDGRQLACSLECGRHERILTLPSLGAGGAEQDERRTAPLRDTLAPLACRTVLGASGIAAARLTRDSRCPDGRRRMPQASSLQRGTAEGRCASSCVATSVSERVLHRRGLAAERSEAVL